MDYTHDSKHNIAQYLYLVHGQRVGKDELLDPIIDDDTIDYSKDSIPWEQQSTSETEPKPFNFAPDANMAQNKESSIYYKDTMVNFKPHSTRNLRI